jgi:hypothetical protein
MAKHIVKPTDGFVLSRGEILDAMDEKMEAVEIPEWGGFVYVKAMTGEERDALEASVVTGPGERNLDNLRAKVVALSLVDAEGVRLFTLDDVEALGKKSASALDKVFSVAQRLSGLSRDDVKDLAGN